jgi:signal transduction histidine kinase
VVKAFRDLPSGRRRVAAFLFPEDVFGLVENGRYLNTTQTVTAVTLYRIPIDELERLFLHDGHLQFQFLCEVTHELRQVQRQAIALTRRDAVGRVAMFFSMLEQLVTDARGMIDRVLGEGVSAQFRLRATTPHVVADPYELEWVLVNLVMNGREAMPDGGLLSVETADYTRGVAEGGRGRSVVRLTVKDTGHLVQPEQQDRASAHPFGRSDSAGVRLANVAVTVEKLSGWFDVDRQGGRGTTVHVDLPVAYGSGDREAP